MKVNRVDFLWLCGGSIELATAQAVQEDNDSSDAIGEEWTNL